MKVNDILIPIRENVQSCVILATPKPPLRWTVRYENGKIRKWSKSHLKKYYYVKDQGIEACRNDLAKLWSEWKHSVPER